MPKWKNTSRRESQRSLIPGQSRKGTPEESATGGARGFFGRRHGTRRKIATTALVALSVFLALYAIFGHDGLVAYQQKRHQSKQLQRQILDAQKENDRVSQYDHRLRNDSDTIEYEARKQMHYTRPGEVIYTLPEAPGSAKSNPK